MIPLEWHPREPPLPVAAVAALSDAAAALRLRLLRCDDAQLGRLTGVAGQELLLLLGEAGDLPWVEGAVWLGRCEDAPRLLMPTSLQPSVPSAWLDQRLKKDGPQGPVALLPASSQLVPVGKARRVSRLRLEALT